MPARRLIVNADDFGRSPGVNQGVLEAHVRGIVTSATVMVLETSAARGIREAAERAPRLSLGLHFVITGGGRPAVPGARRRSAGVAMDTHATSVDPYRL